MNRLSHFFTVALLALSFPANANTDLPALGDSASGYVSLQQEHQLGRTWLRQLRAQAPTIDTPLMTSYLENLVYRLIPHSDVKQSELEFVIVDSGDLNAFAVPGGIIGINYGLMLHARDEDELSAVLAHELAHLSQRHFARQIEQAQKQEPVALATLLASILLIATNNPDAGFAGLMTTQAAGIQNQLAYSREWEREADRLGMQTLVTAGFDPGAMPSMFEQMLKANRFGGNPPEFLLTHPLTESRIADAADRAQQYPAKPRLTGFEFSILKNTAISRYQLTSANREQYFQERLDKATTNSEAAATSAYSLAEIAIEKDQWSQASALLARIAEPWASHAAVIDLGSRIDQHNGDNNKALQRISDALAYQPSSLLLRTRKAELLALNKRFPEAISVLKNLTSERKTDPLLWQQLGRIAAAGGQPLIAYRANGEYLFFSGRHAQALRQMDLALEAARKAKDFQQESLIRQRLETMASSPRDLNFN